MPEQDWKKTGVSHESGQAWVYQVKRTGQNDFFALKKLKNLKRRARFVREVETMNRLLTGGLDCIPQVIDTALNEERPYFVMPWYADGSLQERVESGEFREDPVGGLGILKAVAIALQSVHNAGVAHRDVKPANVLLAGDSIALSDFGLCLDAEADEQRLTSLNEGVGSRLYIAPENEAGINDDDDQKPADFYAFAKMLWAVLAGREPRPREGQLVGSWRLETLLGDARFEILGPVQEKLLGPDPRSRLGNWGEVIAELDVAITHLTSTTTRASTPTNDLLVAARRLRDIPGRESARAAQQAAGRDSTWLASELQEALVSSAQQVERDVLDPVVAASDGAIEATLVVLSVPTPAELERVQNATAGKLPPGLALVTDELRTPIAFRISATDEQFRAPLLFLSIMVAVRPDGIYLLAVPLLMPMDKSGEFLVPVELAEMAFVASGPHSVGLAQSLEAASAFVAGLTPRLEALLLRYMTALRLDGNLALPSAWVERPPFIDSAWSLGPALPEARAFFGAASTQRGLIVCGGQARSGFLATIDELDPESGSWSSGPSLPAGCVNAMGVATRDGNFHLLGGEINHVRSQLHRRQSRGQDWESLAPLPEPRSDGAAAILESGEIFVFGGVGPGDTTDRVDAYSPVSDAWTTRSSLPVARKGLAAAVGADGRIYLFGGMTASSSGVITARVDAYDPEADEWHEVRDMPTPRAWCSAACDSGGRIWVVGGFDPVVAVNDVVEILDPRVGWSEGPALPRARYAHKCLTASDGRLYVLGGDAPYAGVLASVVTIEPMTWSPSPGSASAGTAPATSEHGQ